MYMARAIISEYPLSLHRYLTSLPLRACSRSPLHIQAAPWQQAGVQTDQKHAEDNPPDLDQIRKKLYGGIEPVIGLEVHAQLGLNSKLFSQGALTNSAPPNSQLDLFDVSIPGTLPKVNRRAVEFAMLTGLALNCNIQDKFSFDRKNYFYADMPAGYQITQYNSPIAKSGYIEFIVTSYHNSLIAHAEQYDVVKWLYARSRLEQEEIRPYIRRSSIKQIQLEQDSAKTLQNIPQSNPDSTGGENAQSQAFSLVDYNRSGSALIEIVFEPDLTNHHEASALVKELIFILKAIGTCDCELQEGSLRVDANVSIKRIDDKEIEDSKKVELKNLNSLRALNRAIQKEVFRQAGIIKAGGKVMQESRTYDSRSKEIKFLRPKETAIDYRYMPEPSIPPINVDHKEIDRLRDELKQKDLPAVLRERLINKYNMELTLVNEVVEEPGLADYLEAILTSNNNGSEKPRYDPEVVADFLIYAISNLRNLKNLMLPIGEINLKDENSEFKQRVPVESMQILFDMLADEEISFATAFEVVKCIYVNNDKSSPREIVENFGWRQINDMHVIEQHCDKCIEHMKSISKKYKRGMGKQYLRRMLDKLCENTENKISVRLAIQCLNSKLRPNDPKTSIGINEK